jgi:hypothetical protein
LYRYTLGLLLASVAGGAVAGGAVGGPVGALVGSAVGGSVGALVGPAAAAGFAGVVVAVAVAGAGVVGVGYRSRRARGDSQRGDSGAVGAEEERDMLLHAGKTTNDA